MTSVKRGSVACGVAWYSDSMAAACGGAYGKAKISMTASAYEKSRHSAQAWQAQREKQAQQGV